MSACAYVKYIRALHILFEFNFYIMEGYFATVRDANQHCHSANILTCCFFLTDLVMYNKKVQQFHAEDLSLEYFVKIPQYNCPVCEVI